MGANDQPLALLVKNLRLRAHLNDEDSAALLSLRRMGRVITPPPEMTVDPVPSESTTVNRSVTASA